MCMQCFWGFEAGVTALGIWRYRHVKRTAHRDLVFALEEEEDWFAFEDAKHDVEQEQQPEPAESLVEV